MPNTKSIANVADCNATDSIFLAINSSSIGSSIIMISIMKSYVQGANYVKLQNKKSTVLTSL